jgi:hypothetical protein
MKTTKMGLYPGQQFFLGEWFEDIVLAASGKSGDYYILPVGAGGDKEDGNVPGQWVLFDGPAGLKSGNAWHVNVEENKIRLELNGGLQGLFAVANIGNQLAGASQQFFCQPEADFIVVGNEDGLL